MRATARRAVALALSVGISGAAVADEADSSSGPVEEVTVTGSRIQRDGMTTRTSVTSISMDDLHVLAPTTLAAAVTRLPQFVDSSVPEGAPASGWTGASGASILNLRGVGANRTLVSPTCSTGVRRSHRTSSASRARPRRTSASSISTDGVTTPA